jgi:hypothetical protein
VAVNRIERIALGLCSACPKPATEGRMCATHAKKNREVTKKVRARRAKLGLCMCCSRKARGRPYYGAYCTLHGLREQMYQNVYQPEYAKRKKAA